MLLPRFLTALVGIPLLIVAIWWGQIPFTILMFGIIMMALWEYYALLEDAAWPIFRKMGLLCGALLTISFFLFGTRLALERVPNTNIFFSPATIFILFIFLVFTSLLSREKEKAFLSIAVTWLGLYYIVWSLSHIFLIRDLRPHGAFFTFFLFFVIWAYDVGAYFGGVKFGRTKLAETVSPKKSWEGVLAGSLTALLVSLVCQKAFLKSVPISRALELGLLIVVLAQISDLSESLFKRNLQVKDSGNLLPGHGGILDRFDSFLLTTPVYYYALIFFVK